MLLSVCFIVLDILSVTKVIKGAGSADGINPYWKVAFVFKCLTDTVVLDDFKTALDRLKEYKLEQLGTIGECNDVFSLVDSRQSSQAKVKRNDGAERKASMWKRPHSEPDVEQLDFCTVPSDMAGDAIHNKP